MSSMEDCIGNVKMYLESIGIIEVGFLPCSCNFLIVMLVEPSLTMEWFPKTEASYIMNGMSFLSLNGRTNDPSFPNAFSFMLSMFGNPLVIIVC